MRHFDGRPLFLPRTVTTPAYELHPHEQELYDAVTDYVSNGLSQAEQSSNRNVTLALIILQRRLASSLYAVTKSLERRRDRLSDELDQAQQSKRSFQPSLGGSLIDYDLDEDEPEELTDADEATLSGASTARTTDEFRAEVAKLNELIALAHSTRQRGPERKVEEFRRAIETQTVIDRNEKILVFTEHVDTLHYLTQQLREWGYSVCNIHGGMRLADRISAEKEFLGPAQFMVASEAAGGASTCSFARS